MSATLRTELEKTYGSGNVTVSKDGDTYTVAITGKSNYTIDSNGKVEKAGPTVAYSNERIVENSAGTGTSYWLASRCVGCDSNRAYFYMRFVDSTHLDANFLYVSDNYGYSLSSHVCPIVSIPSSVQVTSCTGTNSSTNTHTVVTN